MISLSSARFRSHIVFWLGLMQAAAGLASAMDRVILNESGDGFVLQPSDAPFAPWGFNYDHDIEGRLIEDYWNADWPMIEEDFAEMKAHGANCVRIHLQFGKFMSSPDKPNEAALAKLDDLLALAERTGLWLNLTGLGCYHKADVPEWYDPLDEATRWEAQANFWRAIASRCASSPAVFCYDLMNEPVVPGGDKRTDWLGPDFAGKHFVQFITLDLGKRERHKVALAWIKKLTGAIREIDPTRLITVGMVDWSLDRPGLTSGFIPEKVSSPLDFLSVHIYPERGKVDEALETLHGFTTIGKPVVIEETFALKCGIKEFDEFYRGANDADGWFGFYWGRTLEKYQSLPRPTIGDAMMRDWLEYFVNARD